MPITTKEDFDALEGALKINNINQVKTILQNFDFTATNIFDRSCLMLCCIHSSSSKVMKLVFEKIVEVGGTNLLNSQLAATSNKGSTCLMFACRFSSSPEVLKLLAVLLFYVGFFKQQCEKLDDWYKTKLREKAGIDSASWTPDAASIAEVEVLLEEGNLIYAIHNNQHSRMKEFFLKKNDLGAKKMLDSRLDIIGRACFELKTNHTTVQLLFSEIKRIGGDQYLRELLLRGNCLLSGCLRHADSERLELFLNTIGEVGGEEILFEQISKCFFALCKSAPQYSSLSLLVSQIFHLLDRRFLRNIINANPCLECIFSRPLNSQDQKKFLFLVVGLYSITGLFEEEYAHFDEWKKAVLRSTCNIQSGEWIRARSVDPVMGDMIGEIKESIKNKN